MRLSTPQLPKANGGAIIVSNVGCPPAEVNKPTSTTIGVASSIFSNTTSDSVAGSDIVTGFGFTLTLKDNNFSLIVNLPSSGITVSNASGSPPLVTIDPRLAPLADNGCFIASGALHRCGMRSNVGHWLQLALRL